MSGCLDEAHCPNFESVSERRNLISSVIGGGLFFIGWWILIDAAVTKVFEPAYHTPGVVSTLAVLMINAVSNAQVRGDSFSYSGGCIGQTGYPGLACVMRHSTSLLLENYQHTLCQSVAVLWLPACLWWTNCSLLDPIWCLCCPSNSGCAAMVTGTTVISTGRNSYPVYCSTEADDPWPGVAIFLQNSLIFFSAIVFKFGRTEESW